MHIGGKNKVMFQSDDDTRFYDYYDNGDVYLIVIGILKHQKRALSK